MLFGLGYRCGLLLLSSKVDICETTQGMRRDCIRTPHLINCAYPLLINEFVATFPCKALAGRWILVGSPMSVKKVLRSWGRVFQLRLPTHTEKPRACFKGASAAASAFFWCFRAARFAACDRMGSSPAEGVPAEWVSSSSSNSDLVRFGMGLESST